MKRPNLLQVLLVATTFMVSCSRADEPPKAAPVSGSPASPSSLTTPPPPAAPTKASTPSARVSTTGSPPAPAASISLVPDKDKGYLSDGDVNAVPRSNTNGVVLADAKEPPSGEHAAEQPRRPNPGPLDASPAAGPAHNDVASVSASENKAPTFTGAAVRDDFYTPSVFCPPEWSAGLIYYQSFERERCQPEVNTAQLQIRFNLVQKPKGVHGHCGAAGGGADHLELFDDKGALSPVHPLTISFWWTPLADTPPQGGFGLATLSGNGFISTFARGGADGWSGLKETAGVAQIYNIPGITNVSGIYDPHLHDHVSLKRGTWHHTAVVISAASLVRVYTDGRQVWEQRTAGRPFQAADKFERLTLGPGVLVDEVMILNHPASSEEIADYAGGMMGMRAAYGGE